MVTLWISQQWHYEKENITLNSGVCSEIPCVKNYKVIKISSALKKKKKVTFRTLLFAAYLKKYEGSPDQRLRKIGPGRRRV